MASSILTGAHRKVAYMSTMAERIKQARTRAELSHQKLAEKVGVSRAAVAQWESGDTKGLRPDNLVAAADALGVSIRWLATGEPRDRPAIVEAREESAPWNTGLTPEATEIARKWSELPSGTRELIRQFIYVQSLLASITTRVPPKSYDDFEKRVIKDMQTKRGNK